MSFVEGINEQSFKIKIVGGIKFEIVQKLRALAVCMVIAYHFELPVKNGYIGVDVFFVISGFVITYSLLKRDTINLVSTVSSFYKRRIIRLFPAFFVFYAITLFLTIVLISPNQGQQQQVLKTSWFSLIGVSNFALPRFTGSYFQQDAGLNPFLHTWSLSVEEQIYFVFPILFFFFLSQTAKFSNKKYTFLLLLGTISLVSIPFRKLGEIGLPTNEIYFSTLARVWEFVLGILAAILLTRRKADVDVLKRAQTLVRAGALSTLIWCSFLPINFENNLLLLIVPNVAIFLILLTLDPHSATSQPSNFSRFFSTIGNASYSIYLWHWPAWVFSELIFSDMYWAQLTFAFFLTSLASILSYKFIERRTMSQEFSYSRMQVLWTFALGQIIGIIIFAFGILGAQQGWGRDWALNSHLIMRKNCDTNSQEKLFCEWNPSGKDTVVLIGDSMGWAIGNSIIDYSKSEQFRLETYIQNRCPPVLMETPVIDECGEWQNAVAERILEIKPKLVVLTSSFGYSEKINTRTGKFARELFRFKIPALLILPPPGGDEFSERRALFFAPGESNRWTTQIETNFDTSLGLDRALLRKMDFFDPADNLCVQNRCIVAENGKDFYTYGRHLSPYGAEYLEQYLWPQLRKLLKS